MKSVYQNILEIKKIHYEGKYEKGIRFIKRTMVVDSTDSLR